MCIRDSDRTAQICRERGYNLLDLTVNLGLAGCFQAGMKYAYAKGYAYAIQFDGDGQHRPEYILPMQEKMKEGYDIVIGSRFLDEKKDLSMRMVGSRLITAAIRDVYKRQVWQPEKWLASPRFFAGAFFHGAGEPPAAGTFPGLSGDLFSG